MRLDPVQLGGRHQARHDRPASLPRRLVGGKPHIERGGGEDEQPTLTLGPPGGGSQGSRQSLSGIGGLGGHFGYP